MISKNMKRDRINLESSVNFTFIFDKDKKTVNMHQTTYEPDDSNISIGISKKSLWNPVPDDISLPLYSYSTTAFSKFKNYAHDVLDLCRLYYKDMIRPLKDQSGGGLSRSRAKGSSRKKLAIKLKAKAEAAAVQRMQQAVRPVCAPRQTQVSARLTRVLLRHNIQDVRMFGFKMPDPVTRVPTWHYTCFLERSAPDPVLGEHDLAFQTSDATWRSAQHAFIRRIKQLEQATASLNNPP
jgi:hypothetical protein